MPDRHSRSRACATQARLHTMIPLPFPAALRTHLDSSHFSTWTVTPKKNTFIIAKPSFVVLQTSATSRDVIKCPSSVPVHVYRGPGKVHQHQGTGVRKTSGFTSVLPNNFTGIYHIHILCSVFAAQTSSTTCFMLTMLGDIRAREKFASIASLRVHH